MINPVGAAILDRPEHFSTAADAPREKRRQAREAGQLAKAIYPFQRNRAWGGAKKPSLAFKGGSAPQRLDERRPFLGGKSLKQARQGRQHGVLFNFNGRLRFFPANRAGFKRFQALWFRGGWKGEYISFFSL